MPQGDISLGGIVGRDVLISRIVHILTEFQHFSVDELLPRLLPSLNTVYRDEIAEKPESIHDFLVIFLDRWVEQSPENATVEELIQLFRRAGLDSFVNSLNAKLSCHGNDAVHLTDSSYIQIESFVADTPLVNKELVADEEESYAPKRFQKLNHGLRWFSLISLKWKVGIIAAVLLVICVLILLACMREPPHPYPHPVNFAAATTYAELKNQLKDVNIGTDTDLVVISNDPTQWPEDFNMPCEQVTRITFQGTMHVKSFSSLLKMSMRLSELRIHGNSTLTGNDVVKEPEIVPHVKNLQVFCNHCSNTYEVLFEQFNFPNLAIVALDGITITSRFSSSLERLFNRSTAVHIFKLNAILETLTPFMPKFNVPSVESLHIELQSQNHPSFIPLKDFHLCTCFDNLKNLSSNNWAISLDAIQYCFALEHLNLVVKNDHGKVINDMRFFADNLPSLETVRLNLTYASSDSCLQTGIEGWSSIQTKPSLESLKVYSPICSLKQPLSTFYVKFQRDKDHVTGV